MGFQPLLLWGYLISWLCHHTSDITRPLYQALRARVKDFTNGFQLQIRLRRPTV